MEQDGSMRDVNMTTESVNNKQSFRPSFDGESSIKRIKIQRKGSSKVYEYLKTCPGIENWNGLLHLISTNLAQNEHEVIAELTTFDGELLTPKNYKQLLQSRSEFLVIASFTDANYEEAISAMTWMNSNQISCPTEQMRDESILIGPFLSFDVRYADSTSGITDQIAISLTMKFRSRMYNTHMAPHDATEMRGPWTRNYGTEGYIAQQRTAIREYAVNLDVVVTRADHNTGTHLIDMYTGQTFPHWWISWQGKLTLSPEAGIEHQPCWWLTQELQLAASLGQYNDISSDTHLYFLLKLDQVIGVISRVMEEAEYGEKERNAMANSIHPYLTPDLDSSEKSINPTVYLLQFIPASQIRKILQIEINPYPTQVLRMLFVLRCSTMNEIWHVATQGSISAVVEQIKGGTHGRRKNEDGLRVMEWGGLLIPKASTPRLASKTMPLRADQEEMMRLGEMFAHHVIAPGP